MESTHVTLSTQSKPVDPLNDKAKAILSGALQVFTTQGYAAASMDRIASAAGVSKPTLYRYFQDKETLFVTLIQQSMQKNRQLLFNLQTAPDLQHAPDNVLRQLATSVLEEFSRNQPLSTLMRLIIGESERFPELARTFVREIQKPLLEDLSGYLAAQTQLQLPDPMVAARIFSGSIVHYLIVQEIMHGKDILPLERDRMIDGLIHLIMAAGKT
ncbi:MAG: TetR/AcrR family transcriptional regulator [Cyanobacteria bacterium P01_A01_bin.123]